MRKMSASRGPNAEETENFLILNSDDEDVEVIADLEGEQEDDLDEDEDAEGGEEDDDEGKTFSIVKRFFSRVKRYFVTSIYLPPYCVIVITA